jgi:hypothetical protein
MLNGEKYKIKQHPDVFHYTGVPIVKNEILKTDYHFEFDEKEETF